MTDPPPPVTPLGLACVGCVTDRKAAEMSGTAEAELPGVRAAITLLGGNAVCYSHIVVARHSPLQVPNGQGLPPGLGLPR